MKARHTSMASSTVRKSPVPSRATTIVSGLSYLPAAEAAIDENDKRQKSKNQFNQLYPLMIVFPFISFTYFTFSPLHFFTFIGFRRSLSGLLPP